VLVVWLRFINPVPQSFLIHANASVEKRAMSCAGLATARGNKAIFKPTAQHCDVACMVAHEHLLMKIFMRKFFQELFFMSIFS